MRLAILCLPPLLVIGGCEATRWRAIDGSAVESAALAQAKRVCRLDARLAEIDAARSASNEALRKSNTNAGKMLIRDDIQLKERALYAALDACMQTRGFKRD